MVALLCSLGGSPEPVLHAIRSHRPSHVGYFCSSGTRALARQIEEQLDYRPASDFLVIELFEELGPCYAALRNWIPGWLAAQAIPADDVIVDYTGGTKTMSAALVLAATETFANFSYTGGLQRDKSGVGVVLSGHERSHYQSNPWRQLAVRELDQAAQLWPLQQYEAVAVVLRRAKSHVPIESRPYYDRVITLALALSDRLALQFPKAIQKLQKIAKAFHREATDPLDPLAAFCRKGIARFGGANATTGPAADPAAQLRELLDNAILTAQASRFDDAAARLYRALELYGQNELARLTGGAVILGQLKSPQLPVVLEDYPPFAGPGGIAMARNGIPLEQVYRVLAHLRHPAGLRAVAEFDGSAGLQSPWRRATQRRNQSILAHGIQPVGPTGYEDLAALVADYTGLDTTAVDLPPPDFDVSWFPSPS